VQILTDERYKEQKSRATENTASDLKVLKKAGLR